jgi:hypothetical protein
MDIILIIPADTGIHGGGTLGIGIHGITTPGTIPGTTLIIIHGMVAIMTGIVHTITDITTITTGTIMIAKTDTKT